MICSDARCGSVPPGGRGGAVDRGGRRGARRACRRPSPRSCRARPVATSTRPCGSWVRCRRASTPSTPRSWASGTARCVGPATGPKSAAAALGHARRIPADACRRIPKLARKLRALPAVAVGVGGRPDRHRPCAADLRGGQRPGPRRPGGRPGDRSPAGPWSCTGRRSAATWPSGSTSTTSTAPNPTAGSRGGSTAPGPSMIASPSTGSSTPSVGRSSSGSCAASKPSSTTTTSPKPASVSGSTRSTTTCAAPPNNAGPTPWC